MSSNKNKYFLVTTTSVVSAPNMASARTAASGKRIAGTKLLTSNSDVERVAAATAQSMSV